jgi:dephospho-CoA kinase
MKERLVLGLAGYPQTGKTTSSNYLADVHGFKIFECSRMIRSTASELGVDLDTRFSFDRFFREQQIVRGMSWLSDIILASEEKRILQTGLRSLYDFCNIKAAGGFVVALTCPPEICINRVDASDAKNPLTLTEYVEHKASEESPNIYGSHTDWCVANADYTIDTSGPVEHTYSELDHVVELMK